MELRARQRLETFPYLFNSWGLWASGSGAFTLLNLNFYLYSMIFFIIECVSTSFIPSDLEDICRFKRLHRWQLLAVKRSPSVALATTSICCFSSPVAQSLPRWTKWPVFRWLCTQRAGERKVTLTSLLGSSSLRLHLQVNDTCFLFQILVMSEHRANNTITALTCQLPDIICAPSSTEAAENIVCVSQNSRS